MKPKRPGDVGNRVLEPPNSGREDGGGDKCRTSLASLARNKAEVEATKQAASADSQPRPPPTLVCLQNQASKCLPFDDEQPATTTPGAQVVKPTWRRYIILLLFSLNWANMSYQWLQIPSCTIKASILYEVDNYAINISAMTFMIVFIVFSWPACFIIDIIGPRRAVIISTLAAAIGATIKCFSCHRNGIWLMLLGQIIVSIGEQFVFSLPNRLASVWFPDHQVSQCVALCINGAQIGLAFGFFLPHWFLEGTETYDQIAAGFYRMFLATSAYSIAVLLICLLLFDNEPKFPPGKARLKQLELERNLASCQWEPNGLAKNLTKLFRQMGDSFRDKQLMLLATGYGTIVGVGYTIETLLDQMLKQIWPNNDLISGNTGFLVIIACILATPVWGRAMDHWHLYKSINLIIAAGLIVSLVLFTSAMVFLKSPLIIYLAAFLMGVFQGGFIVAGLEYAIELTYPAPELVTASVMNLMPQVHSIIHIFFASYITDHHGVLAAGAFLVLLLSLGTALVLATRQTLRRQQAIASMPAWQAALQN